jgi:hypothetical protein
VFAKELSRWYLVPAGCALGLVALASANAFAVASVPMGTSRASTGNFHATADRCHETVREAHARVVCLDVTAFGFAAGERVRAREYLQPGWQ